MSRTALASRFAHLTRILSFSTLSMVATTAEAGLFGRIDSVIAADNVVTNHNVYLEEQVDLAYVDEHNGWRLGSSLSLQMDMDGDHAPQGEIYHLYAEKRLTGKRFSSIKLGRMQRSDALGFYTLDGAQLQGEYANKQLTLYGGSAGRIDDHHFVGADLLLGGALQWQREGIDYRFGNIEINDLVTRAELQQLRKDQSQSRFNWILDGDGRLYQSSFNRLKVNFGGSYRFGQNRLEELLFSAELRRDREEMVKLNYQSFAPVSPTLSFREQFYSLYALGEQSELAASYHQNARKQPGWQAKGRLVTRENGLSGGGVTGGISGLRQNGFDMSGQIDLLRLGGDRASTIYIEGQRSLNAMSRLRLALVTQHERKTFSGNNHAFGIDGEWERMVNRSLYMTANFSHIWNSRLNDEYRYGLRLSYRFDDRKEWLQ